MALRLAGRGSGGLARPLTCAVALLMLAAATASAASPRIGTDRPDVLTGTPGSDVIAGMGGADDVFAAAGDDVVAGGDGDDQVLGGRGHVISAGRGSDQVHADDRSPDVVSCGPGADTVYADRADRVAGDCEADGRALLRGGALATFAVAGERFRAWVTSATTIWELHELAGGRSAANIPVGSLRRGPGRAGHNAPFSWHLDPRDTAQAEMTIELCDARPSYVEDHRDEFVDVVGAYCPWGARLVELRNYGGRLERPPAGPPGPVELPDPDPR
jgi:RTX calcium-binding nonapeptide repeat (4 copies)